MEFSAGYFVLLLVGFIAVVLPSAIVAIRFWSVSRFSRACVLVGILVLLVLGILMLVGESDPSPSALEWNSLLFIFIWGVWFYTAMLVYGVVQGSKALVRKKSD